MTFQFDVEAALHELAAARDRIFELLEWHAVSLQERKQPRPPIFDLDTVFEDHVRDDLLAMNDLFLSLDMDVAGMLNNPDLDCTPRQLHRWRGLRERLESQVLRLHISERFIRR